MSGFRRFLHPNSNRPAEDEQFAPDGRNLSDTTHPEYDPATDPELREFAVVWVGLGGQRQGRLAWFWRRLGAGAEWDRS